MLYKKGDKVKYIGDNRLSLEYGDIVEVDSIEENYVLVQTKTGSYLFASFDEVEHCIETSSKCDCGAEKVKSPFHYSWCSTNKEDLPF